MIKTKIIVASVLSSIGGVGILGTGFGLLFKKYKKPQDPNITNPEMPTLNNSQSIVPNSPQNTPISPDKDEIPSKLNNHKSSKLNLRSKLRIGTVHDDPLYESIQTCCNKVNSYLSKVYHSLYDYEHLPSNQKTFKSIIESQLFQGIGSLKDKLIPMIPELAAMLGLMDIFKLSISQNPDRYGSSLFSATIGSHKDIVEYILSDPKHIINPINLYKSSLIALQNNNVEIFNILWGNIENSADFSNKDFKHLLPILELAAKNNNTDLVNKIWRTKFKEQSFRSICDGLNAVVKSKNAEIFNILLDENLELLTKNSNIIVYFLLDPIVKVDNETMLNILLEKNIVTKEQISRYIVDVNHFKDSKAIHILLKNCEKNEEDIPLLLKFVAYDGDEALLNSLLEKGKVRKEQISWLFYQHRSSGIASIAKTTLKLLFENCEKTEDDIRFAVNFAIKNNDETMLKDLLENYDVSVEQIGNALGSLVNKKRFNKTIFNILFEKFKLLDEKNLKSINEKDFSNNLKEITQKQITYLQKRCKNLNLDLNIEKLKNLNLKDSVMFISLVGTLQTPYDNDSGKNIYDAISENFKNLSTHTKSIFNLLFNCNRLTYAIKNDNETMFNSILENIESSDFDDIYIGNALEAAAKVGNLVMFENLLKNLESSDKRDLYISKSFIKVISKFDSKLYSINHAIILNELFRLLLQSGESKVVKDTLNNFKTTYLGDTLLSIFIEDCQLALSAGFTPPSLDILEFLLNVTEDINSANSNKLTAMDIAERGYADANNDYSRSYNDQIIKLLANKGAHKFSHEESPAQS